MKVVIAGSRTIDDSYYKHLLRAIKYSGFDLTEVVSGTARGVDRLGEKFADANGIKLTRMPADWNTHGKAAGPIRNQKMGEYADAGIILWDGHSAGAVNMLDVLKRLHKPYFFDLVKVN